MYTTTNETPYTKQNLYIPYYKKVKKWSKFYVY